MNGHYVLIGQTPVPCEDLMEFAVWFEQSEARIVKQERVLDMCFVSTVFLALDHNFMGGASVAVRDDGLLGHGSGLRTKALLNVGRSGTAASRHRRARIEAFSCDPSRLGGDPFQCGEGHRGLPQHPARMLIRHPRRCKPEFGAPELVMVYREKNAEKEN